MSDIGKAVLKRSVSHNIAIKLTGKDVAELFWQLDAVEQAEFFNTAGTWYALTMQLQAVTDCGYLNTAGRRAMSRIGEYSSPTEPTGYTTDQAKAEGVPTND